MDYLCAKFGDFSFGCLGFYREDRQRCMIATHATTISMSNYLLLGKDSDGQAGFRCTNPMPRICCCYVKCTLLLMLLSLVSSR